MLLILLDLFADSALLVAATHVFHEPVVHVMTCKRGESPLSEALALLSMQPVLQQKGPATSLIVQCHVGKGPRVLKQRKSCLQSPMMVV